MSDKKFYIVWSPDGDTPPREIFPSHQSATFVSWYMARKHPGRSFYVLSGKQKPALVKEEVVA